MVSWMRSKSAERRLFGFAEVALFAWVDGKSSDKN